MKQTIEERAKGYALNAVFGDSNDALYQSIETECIKLATEQDRIARKEERERCIKIACSVCSYSEQNGGRCAADCGFMERFRKAMEE